MLASPGDQKQRALKSVRSVPALDLFHKLLQNARREPECEKYRRVKLRNAKIAEAFTTKRCDLETARVLFSAFGWEEEEGEGEEEGDVPNLAFVLPTSRGVPFGDLRQVDESRAALQKDLQQAFRRRVAERSAQRHAGELCELKQTLLKELEADKKERAAKGPVTEGSKRVDGPLGNQGRGDVQSCCGGSAGS